MRRTALFRWLGIVAVALVALSISTRPTIRAGQAPAVVAASAVGGGFAVMDGSPLINARTVHLAAKPMTTEATRIWMKLQEKVSMQFPNETTLDDVVKYIRATTVDKPGLPDGIPIYVNPIGLQEAEKTMASTVTMDLKGIPLATTLKLLLDQLGLTYHIHADGLLVITNQGAEGEPVDAEALILDNLAALRAEVRALHAELHLLRPGAAPGSPTADRPPANAPAGGLGTRGGMM